jgi:uncharacterized protein (TIGR00369 family)
MTGIGRDGRAASDGVCTLPMATPLTPPNPAFAERVRDSFARQPFMGFLGAEVLSIEAGRVAFALPHRAELTQQHGYFHGGAIGTLADNACGYAAFTLAAAEQTVLTVEYKLNLCSPGVGERLIARGEVLRPGRTLVVCRADVFAETAGSEKLVATALATLMLFAGQDDGPRF